MNAIKLIAPNEQWVHEVPVPESGLDMDGSHQTFWPRLHETYYQADAVVFMHDGKMIAGVVVDYDPETLCFLVDSYPNEEFYWMVHKNALRHWEPTDES